MNEIFKSAANVEKPRKNKFWPAVGAAAVLSMAAPESAKAGVDWERAIGQVAGQVLGAAEEEFERDRRERERRREDERRARIEAERDRRQSSLQADQALLEACIEEQRALTQAAIERNELDKRGSVAYCAPFADRIE